jgi:hypothetical protein
MIRKTALTLPKTTSQWSGTFQQQQRGMATLKIITLRHKSAKNVQKITHTWRWCQLPSTLGLRRIWGQPSSNNLELRPSSSMHRLVKMVSPSKSQRSCKLVSYFRQRSLQSCPLFNLHDNQERVEPKGQPGECWNHLCRWQLGCSIAKACWQLNFMPSWVQDLSSTPASCSSTDSSLWFLIYHHHPYFLQCFHG